MALLKAGKSESVDKSKQKLISSLNRGGLRSITEPAQQIFLRTQHCFRELSPNFASKGVDLVGITSKATSDSDVLAYYSLMDTDSDIKPDSRVRKDVLHSIINLYVRVCSFSFAKDIIRHYKIEMKQIKGKALRKDISRSSDDHRQETCRQE